MGDWAALGPRVEVVGQEAVQGDLVAVCPAQAAVWLVQLAEIIPHFTRLHDLAQRLRKLLRIMGKYFDKDDVQLIVYSEFSFFY